jgi:hypothetical protein
MTTLRLNLAISRHFDSFITEWDHKSIFDWCFLIIRFNLSFEKLLDELSMILLHLFFDLIHSWSLCLKLLFLQAWIIWICFSSKFQSLLILLHESPSFRPWITEFWFNLVFDTAHIAVWLLYGCLDFILSGW